MRGESASRRRAGIGAARRRGPPRSPGTDDPMIAPPAEQRAGRQSFFTGDSVFVPAGAAAASFGLTVTTIEFCFPSP
jgi:hypothetical protein